MDRRSIPLSFEPTQYIGSSHSGSIGIAARLASDFPCSYVDKNPEARVDFEPWVMPTMFPPLLGFWRAPTRTIRDSGPRYPGDKYFNQGWAKADTDDGSREKFLSRFRLVSCGPKKSDRRGNKKGEQDTNESQGHDP